MANIDYVGPTVGYFTILIGLAFALVASHLTIKQRKLGEQRFL